MKFDENKIEIAKKIYGMLPRWKLVNEILTDFFNTNRSNSSKEIILMKIALVDSFYKTNLKDQISIAEHISGLHSLDESLNRGDIEIVEKIAKCNNKYFVSFASKFCHFHNKKSFPIYDQYVCLSLKRIMGWKGREYHDFFEAIAKFKIENNLTNVSFDDIDKFLWLYGMMDKLKNNRMDLNREILHVYSQNKELFQMIH